MASCTLSSEEDIVARFAAATANQPKVKTTKKTVAGPVFHRLTFMLKRLQLAKDSVRRTFADVHSRFKDCAVKTQLLNELDKCQACVHEVELALGDTLDDLKQPKVRAALERPDDVKVAKKRKAPPEEESASQASASQASDSQVSASPASGSQATASQDSGSLASESQAKAERRKAQMEDYLKLRKQGKDHYSSWQTAVQETAARLGVTPNFGCRKGSELYIKAKEFQKWGHF